MKGLKRILLFCAVLTAALCAAAYADASNIQAASAPSVNGRAIAAEDLSDVPEITLRCSTSANASTQAAFYVSFYDRNGKFIGAGMAAQTLDGNATTSVKIPAPGNMSGAESVKVLITDMNFRPLLNARSYRLNAGNAPAHENETPILFAFGA